MCLELEKDLLRPLGVRGQGHKLGCQGARSGSVVGSHTGMGEPIISLETYALLQRRLQDARTMKPFAEMFRAADSGQGLLGREPAVCIGAFPIAGPSGEACSEKQEKKKKTAPTLKADTRFGS